MSIGAPDAPAYPTPFAVGCPRSPVVGGALMAPAAFAGWIGGAFACHTDRLRPSVAGAAYGERFGANGNARSGA